MHTEQELLRPNSCNFCSTVSKPNVDMCMQIAPMHSKAEVRMKGPNWFFDFDWVLIKLPFLVVLWSIHIISDIGRSARMRLVPFFFPISYLLSSTPGFLIYEHALDSIKWVFIFFSSFFFPLWLPNSWFSIFNRRFSTTMRLIVALTTLTLLGSAAFATPLPACSTTSKTPCGCPGGTSYEESVTFATIGAKATDVKALIGDCTSPTCFLFWPGVIGFQSSPLIIVFKPAWLGGDVPFTTQGRNNHPGALRRFQVSTAEGAHNSTEKAGLPFILSHKNLFPPFPKFLSLVKMCQFKDLLLLTAFRTYSWPDSISNPAALSSRNSSCWWLHHFRCNSARPMARSPASGLRSRVRRSSNMKRR